jgi:glutamate/tyrosine decarboxylase-like PLP-dependent enzyme
MKGSERADSITMAPHKHLSATLQCSFVLVKDKATAGKCLSASADYLFGSNKCYNHEYDIGDRKFQCTTKCDSFKLWLMFKARGLHDIVGAIDNSLACAEYLASELHRRPDFRPVLDQFEMTNVCFWYIPQALRGQPESTEWWQAVYDVVPKIKAKLLMAGKLGTNFSAVKHRGVGNFSA